MADPNSNSSTPPNPRLSRSFSALTPRAVIIALLCNLLWAGAYVTGKQAIGTPDAPGFGPFRAAFFRFALAGVLLALGTLWRNPQRMRIARQDWGLFGRLALLGMCLTYLFNYTGLSLSTGTAASLIMATEPVWIALIALLFLRERLTLSRSAGIVLGLTGAILVVLSTQRPTAPTGHSNGNSVLIGNLLMVASLLWEAFAVLTVKQLTRRYSGLTIVIYEFLIGSVLLAPFALWEGLHSGFTAPSPTAWTAFIYLVVGCTLIAYTLWFYLLETIDASVLTVFIFLQPVVGTLLGIFLFGDPFTIVTGVGAVLVLGGVLCILETGKRRRDVGETLVDGS